jgi:glycosyltransferase involved in cell wall biosynthesis
VPLVLDGVGAAAARHEGVQRATGDIVLLLDDDVEALPGLVSGHARRHGSARGLVVVGYMPPDLDGDRGADGFSVQLYAEAYERRCRRYEEDPDDVLRNLWSGNISMRRADCLRIGLVSEDYTERYHEDREFGLRCLEAGLAGVFDRSLEARHLYSRPLDPFAADARSQGAGSTLVKRLHPAAAGPLPRDRFVRGLPRPLAAFVELCRRPRLARAASAALTLSVRLAGVVRARPIQLVAARLLRRIEQQRGAIEARRAFIRD